MWCRQARAGGEEGPSHLRRSSEDLAHHPIVHLVGAVVDDALPRYVLGQILDALRLAGAGGAGRCGAERETQRTGDGQPAALGQRRDDEPRARALVLVSVF